ncbi:hypothetical protein J4859_01105 [Atopobium sp. oral taxon 416]|nr:hypothetical protein [Atopobium sp. oral taxon 416]QUC03594.1 hypothetical protein J4859_01105 [Atopobium sp. oral taxon 416]
MARIMGKEGLMSRGTPKKKCGYSSQEGEISAHPNNRVRQDFAAGLPNFLVTLRRHAV